MFTLNHIENVRSDKTENARRPKTKSSMNDEFCCLKDERRIGNGVNTYYTQFSPFHIMFL